MTAQLIDGVALSKRLRHDLAERAAVLRAAGRPAGLAVLLVGDDPASRVYVRNKVKACGETGIHSVLEEWPADTSEATLKERIHALNADASIHGILVQLPLPKHLNAQEIIETIAPEKDVDGLQVHSGGALLVGQPGLRPCTPLGIMAMLKDVGATLKGARAVVIGRSATVGKPVALLLLEADATVTICHSRSGDISGITRAADIVVVAVGRQNVLTADMVKPGAIVIDVGINRDAAGKLCGDVDFAGVSQVAGWITPVPGGVGPMTITMLLANTVTAAESKRR